MPNKGTQQSILLYFLFTPLLFYCSTKQESEKVSDTESIKFQQYIIKGEQLYLEHCSNCHQKNGSGLGLLYPPLNQSDFMSGNLKEVLCLMKFGIKGELLVNGKNYNKEMPGIPTLTDLEIAEIATYIYNNWNHKNGLIEVQQVSKVLATCQ